MSDFISFECVTFEYVCLAIPIWLFLCVLLGKQAASLYRTLFCRCLARQLNGIYLYGVPIARLYGDQFFPRYRHTFNYGFCYCLAGLTMLALRDIPSSRIVLADATDWKGEVFEHEWVELRYGGIWWAIDPTWCEPFFVRRSALYKHRKPKIKMVCSHSEFWSYSISAQFEEKLRQPGTSFLFFELYSCYTHYSNHPDEMFHPYLAGDHKISWHGRCTDPVAHVGLPDEVLFTKRIVFDLVTRPKRLRPKAKHIRHARKLRRLYLQDYKRYLAQHKAEIDAQLEAAGYEDPVLGAESEEYPDHESQSTVQSPQSRPA